MERTQERQQRLRIWQQNINKSLDGQNDLLHRVSTHDMVLIQEPYIDFLGNTRATPGWTVVYPTGHKDRTEKTRSVILVNSKLHTATWKQVGVAHPDITAIALTGPFGTIRIFNIYNDGDTNDTIFFLRAFLRDNPISMYKKQPARDIWAGDFNRHHPLWELPTNTHLLTQHHIDFALPLSVMTSGMTMILPEAIPTLRAFGTGNLTRPDNVFCTPSLAEAFVICRTAPEMQPVKTDHFPILYEIDVELTRHTEKETYDFHNVDWAKFREELKQELEWINNPREIEEEEELYERIQVIEDVLEKIVQAIVPKIKVSIYTKRWWTNDLSVMRKGVRRAKKKSLRKQHQPDHPIHEEHRILRNSYTSAIRKAKLDHWTEWLEELVSNGVDVWKLSKLVTNPSSDGGRTRIPELETRTADTVTYVDENEEKAKAFYREFFPRPPETSWVPTNHDYPRPKFKFNPITNQQVERTFKGMKQNKATKPGTPHNNVMRNTADLLAPHIGPIFRATFTLKTYPGHWAESLTVVLRKPGKPDYRKPGAYRPVNISHGFGRAINACVKEDIQYWLEKRNIIPRYQFGGRAGRTTTDAIIQLTTIVKEAWRRGEVATALLLDVKGAFPSVHIPMLLHELRTSGVPSEYVDWIDNRLRYRWTKIVFDDFESEPFPIENGLDQGCPGSGVYWNIYNAPVLKLLRSRAKEHGVVFMDDKTILTTGPNFTVTHQKLEDVMNRDWGIMDWSTTHNCSFRLDKFQAIDFTRKTVEAGQTESGAVIRRIEKGEPIDLGEHIVEISDSVKLLGIHIDSALRWTIQLHEAIKKGQQWINAFRRVSKTSGGVAAPVVRQYYRSIAIPRMLYGAEVWLLPQRTRTKNGKGTREISKATITKLTTIQRQAAIIITGAMRTTATDTLEYHANLLPMRLQITLIQHRAALRLCTIPDTHPLYPKVRKASRFRIKRHRGPIEELIQMFKLKPEQIETINAVRQDPKWTFSGKLTISDRETAKRVEKERSDEWRLYTDGSAVDGKVGAAAVLYKGTTVAKTIRYHIGSAKHHGSYEAEAVAMVLGSASLGNTTERIERCTFFVDCQSAIQAVEGRAPKPASYIWDLFHQMMDANRRRQPRLVVEIHWIPGHQGVEGNEQADEEAKKAAGGDGTDERELPMELREGLPFNVLSERATFAERIKKRWQDMWRRSPRYAKLNRVDPSAKPTTFQKLTKGFGKIHTSIIVQLRTGHAPLNRHLFKIKKIETPMCPACGRYEETVMHYLLQCTAYSRQRHNMRATLKRQTLNMKMLLAQRKNLPALINYVEQTKRFTMTFPRIPTLELCNEK